MLTKTLEFGFLRRTSAKKKYKLTENLETGEKRTN